jgi:ubiquinone/menaquinone biosynthesis C-methylase UbiE
MMHTTPRANDEQTTLWNGPAGRAWVEEQESLDRMFESFESMLADTVVEGSRVLDIGCGTGATTIAAARRAGPEGRVTGIDVSEPMLALARERAARAGVAAQFMRADAQIATFEPASFDSFISRFGVMFFGDPVAAFANLHRAARAGGALNALAFRSAAENPFMTAAERAAAPFLPDMPPRRADAPGQFAFADRDRVRDILESAGWREIDIRHVDVVCTLERTQLDRYVTRLGPVGMALAGAPEDLRDRILGIVRAAFAPFVAGREIRFTAACWMVSARAAR